MAASKKVDTTLVVLREIRDAVKATNGRVDALATEVSTMQRQHLESDIRLPTASTDVHATTKDPAALIREPRAAQRIVAAARAPEGRSMPVRASRPCRR